MTDTVSFLPVTCNEFIVLNSPKSVEFKGTSDLPSESLSDVLAAPLGFSIGDSAKFDGLFVKDPFSSAQSVVTVVVEGVDSLDFKVNFSRKIYSVKLHNNLVISERQVIQSCRRRAQFRGRVPHQSHGSQPPCSWRWFNRQSQRRCWNTFRNDPATSH